MDEVLNIIPLEDLARLALRDFPGAGRCLIRRLDEAAFSWSSFSPFDRRAISAACGRELVPGAMVLRDNVVGLA